MNAVPIWTMAAITAAIVGLFLILAWRHAGNGYERRPLLTNNEREFHRRLRRALPEYEIYPQVPILALLQPRGGARRGAWTKFKAISNRRVDWVIADGEHLAIVELDDRTHNPRADRKRDQILGKCGYPVVRYDSRNKPDIGQIRRDVTPHLT